MYVGQCDGRWRESGGGGGGRGGGGNNTQWLNGRPGYVNEFVSDRQATSED